MTNAWRFGRPAAFAIVGFLALLVHAPALFGGFIWLDHAHLEGRLALAPEGDFWAIFTRGFAGTGFYRPLTSLSLSLDAWLGGSPFAYHATTLAWHAAAAIMVVSCGELFGLGLATATLAGLLFAVHPLTSLVASAIAFRSESMLAVALLALIGFHVRRRPLLAALSLLAGALTKETALVLGPLFIAALELGGLQRATRSARQRVLVAEGLALAAALALRLSFAPEWRASFPDLTLDEAFGTRFAALAKSGSAFLAFLARDRSVCDSFPVTSLLSAEALAGVTLAAALGFWAWQKRGPALLLALALLPSLQFVPVMRWWSPHYLYVPLAFGALALARGLEPMTKRARLVALAAIAGFAVLAFRTSAHFESDRALFEREVAFRPECREAQFYLGEVARFEKQWDRAAHHYERAIASDPKVLSFVDLGAAYANLGVVRLEQGRGADATTALRSALDHSSDPLVQRHLVHNLAIAALISGDAAEAARLLEDESRRSDALPQAILVRAKALLALGRGEEAELLLDRP
jgi:tetratricopeptide (TPR) repeat protein